MHGRRCVVADVAGAAAAAAAAGAVAAAAAAGVGAAGAAANASCIVVHVDAGTEVEICLFMLLTPVADAAGATVRDVSGWRGRPRAELRSSKRVLLTMGSASSVTGWWQERKQGERVEVS